MKEIFRFLTLVVLSVCMVGFALDQLTSTSTAYAVGEACPELSSARPSEKEILSITGSLHPVILIAAGCACILSGIIAILPLLIDDPVLRKEAGILLRSNGFARENMKAETVNRGG